MNRPKPCLLIILDGWGINPSSEGNAFQMARAPFLKSAVSRFPNTRLACSGQDVGLPPGIMGNSEVGHLNIGAGRIVYQDLLRIDSAVKDGTFFENPALAGVMDAVRDSGHALHLLGLVSDGGVHSQFTHLTALLDMARRRGVERTWVHVILDGRDTPPHAGVNYLRRLQEHLHANRHGAVASVCGRYFAMDRDRRWDRTALAYALYSRGEGRLEKDPVAAVEAAYARDETDEFVRPIAIAGTGGQAAARVEDGDGVIFFNFRADRARQITRAFTAADFDPFDRLPHPKPCGFVCMCLYDESFDLPVAFPSVHLKNILGEVISRAGLRQLRIAETEKYAHVTYFFNGGEETPFEGEDRCMIPSPRDVPTYDLRPAMSAEDLTAEVLGRIAGGGYDLIVLNFANMDMVGHTGVLEAAVQACETVDGCVQRIVSAVRAVGGAVLITADHGNAEKMIDDDGGPHTAHTLNPVRLVLVDERRSGARLRAGRLADIAPTIMELLDIDPPAEMTGRSLLES